MLKCSFFKKKIFPCLQEYVIIAPSPKKKRVFTEHQKEIMRSRRSGDQALLPCFVSPVCYFGRFSNRKEIYKQAKTKKKLENDEIFSTVESSSGRI